MKLCTACITYMYMYMHQYRLHACCFVICIFFARVCAYFIRVASKSQIPKTLQHALMACETSIDEAQKSNCTTDHVLGHW